MTQLQRPVLIDTHAHLDDRQFADDLEGVLERAQTAGVEQIMTIGINLPGSRAAIALAQRYPTVYATVGVHPHDAQDLDPVGLDELRRLAYHPKVVAIGEIGLDYYRMLSPREAQQRAFEAQLRLAQDLELPVVIHTRDAAESDEASRDVLDTLRNWRRSGTTRGGVLHCFSGDTTMLEEAMAIGFYIGLDGPVTYPKAVQTHEVAQAVPLDRLLVETDSPYLAPQRWRGKRNEPAYVVAVAEKIAALRGTTLDEIARQTTANAILLFPHLGGSISTPNSI